MSRSSAQVHQGNVIPGEISVGDLTNDPNYDSNYVVDFVNFQSLDVVADVPEPDTLALAGLAIGVAGIAGRRRRAPI